MPGVLLTEMQNWMMGSTIMSKISKPLKLKMRTCKDFPYLRVRSPPVRVFLLIVQIFLISRILNNAGTDKRRRTHGHLWKKGSYRINGQL